MNKINKPDFLLTSALAEKLFYGTASPLPIIDYHNHLNPAHLSENYSYENISRMWVTSDPYKHRAMRICGLPEAQITGGATDKEKFINWCVTLPKTAGNPLFTWSITELKLLFGIDEMPCAANAERLWEQCNDFLSNNKTGAMDILKGMNVSLLCTSDDFCDDIAMHPKASASGHGIKVLPSLRADMPLNFWQPAFSGWLKRLESFTNVSVTDLTSFCQALVLRMDDFAVSGCVISDHSLEAGFTYVNTDYEKAETVFRKVLDNKSLTNVEIVSLRSHLLYFLGLQYGTRGWIMQLHLGAHRSTSSRLRLLAGPAGGYAAIGSSCDIGSLCAFINDLEIANALPDTFMFTLNPADNAALASITGSFTEDGIPGKIQFGPAWWYNDHLAGIREQLTVLSSYGLISQFVGMTTDSRSVLSFSRHDYFRRILCSLLGEWAAIGLLPDDEPFLSEIVTDISLNNIKRKLNKRINHDE